MHSILKSEKGMYSIHSQYSHWYITLIRSCMYKEIFTGTYKECEAWMEENTAPESVENDQ